MHHHDPCLALNGHQLLYQGCKSFYAMSGVKGHLYNLTEGPEHCHGTFYAGNIMPVAFIFNTPEDNFTMDNVIFSYCRFYLFADTNALALPAQIEHCGLLTDFLADVQVLGGKGQTITLPF